MAKTKVGIIFGGRSVEHEVSLLSAKSVIKNTDKDKYEIYPIFIDKNGLWHSVSIEQWLEDGDLIVKTESFLTPSLNYENPLFFEIKDSQVIDEVKLDAVFPVLHGTYGEDGTIQGMLEMMGVPFVGASVLGSSVGMDKIVMKAVLKEANLPVVPYFGFYSHDWMSDNKSIIERTKDIIGFPCFVKSADLGSSVGVYKVESESGLNSAIGDSCKYSNRILIEKAVGNPREIEISVLGHETPQASLPGEIVPHRDFYDYTAKYLEEGTGLIAPAELDEELTNRLKELAVKAFVALDCSGMGRVDFLLNGSTQELYIGEINTIPGFTQISMYPKLWEISGVGYTELISRLFDLAIHRKNEQLKLTTDIKSK
ncbi:MAG: D-alanine--D-alanine ligase family protein [Thermodesulfobacteriota bacterium]